MSERIAPYKGLRIANSGADRARQIKDLMQSIIAASEIDIPAEKIAEEVEYTYACNRKSLRMEYMARGRMYDFYTMDTSSLRAQIEEDAIWDYKEERILNHIIEAEKLSVSVEELERKAAEMAEKEQASPEMVKRFFGEDYSGLTSYVLKEKAQELIWRSAIQ